MTNKIKNSGYSGASSAPKRRMLKSEPFACVTLGFTFWGENCHLIKTMENLHLLERGLREKYRRIIDRYGKENLMRLIKQTSVEFQEAKVYGFSITFNAELIENLWNITEWQLWFSESEAHPPVLVDKWVSDAYERVNLVEAQRAAPKTKYPELEKAMRHNPRIVVRASRVLVNGNPKFLALCANNCRPYIVDRYRVRVSDDFMWSIEKTDIADLIAGLKRKDMRDSRLAWGLADSLEDAQRICMEYAEPIWRRVNKQHRFAVPKATTTGMKDS